MTTTVSTPFLGNRGLRRRLPQCSPIQTLARWAVIGTCACLGLASCKERTDPQGPQAVTSADVVSNLPSIVFLGDSLTAGRGLEEAESLPALIQQRLDASKHNYRAINGGRSGDTSKSGLSRLDWYLRDSVNMSILVVGLGSNDAMRGLPIGELEVNLRTIIEKARAARPGLKILLWELHTFPNMGADYSAAYAAVFPRIAAETGALLIPFPLQDVAGLADLNQDDGIHPSAEGTRKVAERIWHALETSM